ncbi:uncharacterized protein VTP21DRAFT_10405 [Calcarisporiella thermophila]|uniref:uncharacterized protein n=1 Tax=Calcarisporiella thermophila TaxID=911321 RepID=UPI00374382E1
MTIFPRPTFNKDYIKLPPGTAVDGAKSSAHLFRPLQIRGCHFKNRIVVSPMCMYSANDGVPNDFHLVHLGGFALRGAALVIAEATAVLPEGRISPDDTGLWNDEQAHAFKRITDFIHSQGALAGIQLAHAGRKASMNSPWKGYELAVEEEGGWPNGVKGPDGERWDHRHAVPSAMSIDDIHNVIDAYVAAARRAVNAGFDVIEIHGAHGYLIHEFYSGNSNSRTDKYGGSLDNRLRLALEIARAVRAVVPEDKALFFRLSASDWTDENVNGGWDVAQSVELSRRLKEAGVDLIDVSSAGNVARQAIQATPGYQVPFAEEIRREADVLVSAVGLITEPSQAEEIVASGKADLVQLAREFLRDASWVLRAARDLGVDVKWPNQYDRAKF